MISFIKKLLSVFKKSPTLAYTCRLVKENGVDMLKHNITTYKFKNSDVPLCVAEFTKLAEGVVKSNTNKLN